MNVPWGPGRPVLSVTLCAHGGHVEACIVDTGASGSYGSTTAVSPAHALCTLGPRAQTRINTPWQQKKSSWMSCKETQKQPDLWPKVVGGKNVFMLSSWCSPGMVEFETLIAEVGLAVSAAFSSLQRLRWLTKTTHDGDAAQTYCVPVPRGQTGAQGDKGGVGVILQ